MPTYCTMPEATPLAPKKTKTFKGLVAGAALAAFLLGTVAATALRAGGGAPKVVVSLSEGGAKCDCQIDTTQEYTDLRKCLDGCQSKRGGKNKQKQFCWNAGWDSKKVYEVCYDATPDGDNYKLKNKDSTGHYTVELAINPHDGNFLKFTCKDSSDQLYADC